MSEKIRVGVVGTSWWSDHFHLKKLNEHPGADLVAVCGRNRTRAEELAVKHAIPQVYTDYQEMIARANLQALVVAPPDDLHYPITMAALEAGLHVLCEKPLALNSNHAKAMLDKAQAADVKHMVLFTNRWLPVQRYLKQLLDEGYLGKCYQINIRFMGDYSRDYSWRFDRQRSNGILGDMGSHMIDLARWYEGDIAQVSGHLSSFINRTDPDGHLVDAANDAATMALLFNNGAQGVIQVSGIAKVAKQYGHHLGIILNGEDATLEAKLTMMGGGEIRSIRSGEKEFHTLKIPQSLYGMNDPNTPFDVFKIPLGHQFFIEGILSNRTVEPTFFDGYKVQQVIDAAIQSDQQGRWVSIA